MNKIIVLMLIVLPYTVVGQNNYSPWILKEADYIKSYKDNCTIVVFEDFEVIRHVIFIEPSIEGLINEKISEKKFGNDIKGILSLQKGDKGRMIIKDIRLILNKPIRNEDVKTVKEELSNLEIELLKSSSETESLSFGFHLYRSRLEQDPHLVQGCDE